MTEEEKILVSIKLDKNVLHITEKRLILAKKQQASPLGGILFGAVGALTYEVARRGIEKLSREKSFTYDEVAQITFLKSKWSRLDPVKLIVQKNNKEVMKIELTPEDGDKALKILQSIPAATKKVIEQYT